MNAPGFRYYQNRFLRVFPALFFVTIGGLGVVVASKGLVFVSENLSSCLIWFLAQISLGQAFNPSLFRDIGVGVINGALWTITTEIIFYLIVPLLVSMEKSFRHTVLLLSLISYIFYIFGPSLFNEAIYRDKSLYDIFALTPIA